MIKGPIQEEDLTIVNIYTPNIEVPKYIKQLLMDIKEEIYSNKIVRDFNTPLISVDRSTWQKISKEIVALNDPLYKIDLIDICRTFHPKTAEYIIFFKCTWNILQDRPYIRPQNKPQ